jgi:hypothetical protein
LKTGDYRPKAAWMRLLAFLRGVRELAASAVDRMKLILAKGSKYASGSWNLLLHPKYFFPLLR